MIIICIKDLRLNWIEFKVGNIFNYTEYKGDDIQFRREIDGIKYFYKLNGDYIGFVNEEYLVNFMSLAKYREDRINEILE